MASSYDGGKTLLLRSESERGGFAVLLSKYNDFWISGKSCELTDTVLGELLPELFSWSESEFKRGVTALKYDLLRTIL